MKQGVQRDIRTGEEVKAGASRADAMASRMLGAVNGDGDDTLKVASVRGNPFIGKKHKVDVERASVVILDGALVPQDEAMKLLGRRIAGVEVGQYDVVLRFTNDTALQISLGGEGMEFLLTSQPPKPTPKPAKR